MKTRKILLAVLMLAIMAFSVAGCTLFFTDRITFTEVPKADYVVGEAEPTFAVQVVRDGKVARYSYPADKYEGGKQGIKLEGFSTATVGTRTAKAIFVAVDDAGTTTEVLSVEFTYTVKTSQKDELVQKDGYYEISSAYDMYLMMTTVTETKVPKYEYAEKDGKEGVFAKECYAFKYPEDGNYKLTANIDFSELSDEQIINYSKVARENLHNFTGKFDGGNFIVSNLSLALGSDADEDGNNRMMGLFFQIAPFNGATVEIKNLNFYNCTIKNSSGAGGGLLGFGAYKLNGSKKYWKKNNDEWEEVTDNVLVTTGKIVVENVNMSKCSVEATKNSSLYIGYCGSAEFKNCTVDNQCVVKAIGTYGAGTFVGAANYMHYKVNGTETKGLVSFDNCSSAATLISNSHVHGFIGNDNQWNFTSKNGCRYNGVIYNFYSGNYTTAPSQGSAYVLRGVANTSNDRYTVYCPASVTATPDTYTLNKTIKDIELSYTSGKTVEINAIEGATTYVFAYSFSRNGSGFGDSFVGTVKDGKVSSELMYYSFIYDNADQTYTNMSDATGLYVTGAFGGFKSGVENYEVTFSVFAMDDNGVIIAMGQVKKSIKVESDYTPAE